jgi:hypothetical protein
VSVDRAIELLPRRLDRAVEPLVRLADPCRAFWLGAIAPGDQGSGNPSGDEGRCQKADDYELLGGQEGPLRRFSGE